jgi:hypothetical protein
MRERNFSEKKIARVVATEQLAGRKSEEEENY